MKNKSLARSKFACESGGAKCRCCTPCANFKVRGNRALRRKLKRELITKDYD